MSAITTPLQETAVTWKLPYRGKVGMVCLIIAESAIFTIFVVAYLFYVGKSNTGPTPREVLETPIFYTICLLSSSLTIHLAGKLLERGRRGVFLGLWLLTIVLGGLFLYGTGQEWHRLIYEHGLTISTNLFGTTAGLILLSIVLLFGLAGHIGPEQSARVDVLSLYWHFVDAVWIVVFTVVYVLGR
jgi:cytochrome c oxidase subunit 3/cytochrome o ubiquinol oxidase subunit 3